MAGIYIHIPFCRQACHYCNFHFATSLTRKKELVAALLKEMELQKNYFKDEAIETIYIGGGTPSLLDVEEIRLQIDGISKHFTVTKNAEITLEANPDDINNEKLAGWKKAGINRLSIGVQSFFQEDLAWMNRAHNAQQAIDNLQMAMEQFDNISIDLIYGHPLLTDEKWKKNVGKAISLDIRHLSCYALTVEPKTPLYRMIREKKKENVSPDDQSEQFLLLMQWLGEAGFEHYEISNFCKPGFRSRHNSSYWNREKYIGIGPSAHSFDGSSRQWNVSNNHIYIESINTGRIPFEIEILTQAQQLNEYIMTSLRTMEGLDLEKINKENRIKLNEISTKYITGGLMIKHNNHLFLTREGKLLADGIAAALFV